MLYYKKNLFFLCRSSMLRPARIQFESLKRKGDDQMAAKGGNARKKNPPAVKKKAEKLLDIYIQYGDKEVCIQKEVLEKITEIWTKDMGNPEEDMKELKVYVKPEDDAAYFVINKDITGSFGL